MFAPLNERHLPFTRSALRIVAGAAYFSHGAMKLFGWFGGVGPDGGPAELMSRYGAAAVIETVLGACLVLGLATRLAAFIASGEMAVAYFWIHLGGSGELWWWNNRGELVMLFSFIWLLYAAWGAGPFSLDAKLAKGSKPPG